MWMQVSNRFLKWKAARPLNNSVSACSSSKNLHFANNSVEFRHRAACLGGPVSSEWCVRVKRECCFTAVVGWSTSARHRQKSEPNHLTRKVAGNRRSEHEETRRVFGPPGPHLSRRASHFRNPVTERRCVCVQGTIKTVKCASAKIHVKGQETYATAICLVIQVNFPMLPKLRAAPKSIHHPLMLKNM